MSINLRSVGDSAAASCEHGTALFPRPTPTGPVYQPRRGPFQSFFILTAIREGAPRKPMRSPSAGRALPGSLLLPPVLNISRCASKLTATAN